MSVGRGGPGGTHGCRQRGVQGVLVGVGRGGTHGCRQRVPLNLLANILAHNPLKMIAMSIQLILRSYSFPHQQYRIDLHLDYPPS